jgi:hypothetical protein
MTNRKLRSNLSALIISGLLLTKMLLPLPATAQQTDSQLGGLGAQNKQLIQDRLDQEEGVDYKITDQTIVEAIKSYNASRGNCPEVLLASDAVYRPIPTEDLTPDWVAKTRGYHVVAEVLYKLIARENINLDSKCGKLVRAIHLQVVRNLTYNSAANIVKGRIEDRRVTFHIYVSSGNQIRMFTGVLVLPKGAEDN